MIREPNLPFLRHDDLAGEDFGIRANKNPVDARPVFSRHFEMVVGRLNRALLLVLGVPGIQQAEIFEDAVDLPVLRGGIEIARQDQRQLLVERLDRRSDQPGSIDPCLLAHVVQVRIYKVELLAGERIPEAHPGHHSGAVRIPGFAGDRAGRFRKPEMVVLQRFEAVLAVKNRHEFSAAAPFSSLAQPGIIRRRVPDIHQLPVNTLLSTEKIGLALGEEFFDDPFALGPGIGIGFIGVAQVEGHHHELCVVGLYRDGLRGNSVRTQCNRCQYESGRPKR